MKGIINTIIVVFGLLAGAYIAMQYFSPVTKAEFDEAHELLNKRIDSLKDDTEFIIELTDELENQSDTIRKDIDTLKAGQKVIYNEVKQGNTSFLDKLFE